MSKQVFEFGNFKTKNFILSFSSSDCTLLPDARACPHDKKIASTYQDDNQFHLMSEIFFVVIQFFPPVGPWTMDPEVAGRATYMAINYNMYKIKTVIQCVPLN